MCGIVAIFSLKPRPGLPEELAKAVDLAAHRGPDGRGELFGLGPGKTVLNKRPDFVPDWGLGHARLAIIDLGGEAAQPMCSGDGKLWIAYNGEIYNYLELRSRLESLGHGFKTASDTEVILAAYTEWGENMATRFIGMFALIIADLRTGRIMVARDRLGVKPLYRWRTESLEVWVSEPKQLTAVAGFQARANRQSVVDFLLDGVADHDPVETFFAEVHRFAPGCTLTWDMGRLSDFKRTRSYWSPPENEVRPQSLDAAVEKTRELFLDSVRLRLRADVPVGASLSGGVDSSAIVGASCRLLQRSLKTYSACAVDPVYNEEPYVDAVVRHCGQSAEKLRLSEEEALDELPAVAWRQDEPFAGFSVHAAFRVMKAAREGGTPVILSGQGSDEVFGGYRKHIFFYLNDLRRAGRWLEGGRLLWRLWRHGDERQFAWRAGARYLPAFLRSSAADPGAWLRPAWGRLARRVWAERSARREKSSERLVDDLKFWSLPVLLRYDDRNGGAWGTEARMPFLDHRLLEHILTIPPEYRFLGGRTKRLLTAALGDALAPEVADRRTKLGFETPQERWLKGRAGEHFEAMVKNSRRLAEILDTRAAVAHFTSFRNGNRQVDHEVLFRLGSLALWLDIFEVEP
jgi:asparagine synthase (glutamine-hydrolysing)